MPSKKTETYNTWNKIAQLYEDCFMELELYNDTYKRFCDLISNPNAAVLEIGCGPGNITKNLLHLKPNLKILATDYSINMVELAKKNNPTIQTKVLDCRNIVSLATKFDAIVCGFTIPYLSNQESAKLLSDCRNLLNENGVFYLSFVAGDYSMSGYISGSTGDRTYFYYHELEAIKHNLALNQFSILETIEKEYQKSDGVAETHTILIAKKLAV